MAESLEIVEERLRASAAAGDFEAAAVALNQYRVTLEEALRVLPAGDPLAGELRDRTQELLAWLNRVVRSSRAHLELRLQSLPRSRPYGRAQASARMTWTLEG